MDFENKMKKKMEKFSTKRNKQLVRIAYISLNIKSDKHFNKIFVIK